MIQLIGIIGDVHAADARLEAALRFFAARGVDKTLCVGDIADGRGDLQHCVDLLRQQEVDCVRGNHDKWFLNEQARDLEGAQSPDALDEAGRFWLAALPLTRQYETAAGRLLLCHGVGANNMCNLRPDDEGYALESNFDLQNLLFADHFRWMINGHTHQRMVRRFGNLVNINSGKIGPKSDGTPTGIWTIDFGALQACFYKFKDDSIVPRPIDKVLLARLFR